MGNSRKTWKANLTGPRAARPTIGLLIGRFGDQRYQADVWPGVADVAEEQDVNLICFVGRELQSPIGFEAQRNVIYNLVSPENVDGLVTLSGTLGHYIGPEQLAHFYKRFSSIPMVSIALALDGIPSVVVDNDKGMRDAITHLIEVHGARRIAFLRGPEIVPEAEQRYRTYTEVLASHGIPLDPALVAPGDFSFVTGSAAIHILLDERKADFEAVVAANDEMALGAMAALQERGRSVPGDVSVVGFDDIEEAGFAAPPLTTARQPLYAQGRRATEMLLDLLAGEKVPERETLSTELVVRQSCGCFSRAVLQAATGPVTWTGETLDAALSSQREQILLEMTNAAVLRGIQPQWAEQLLDAFSADLTGKSPGAFLPALRDVLRLAATTNVGVPSLQGTVSALRRCALPYLGGGESLSRAEDLLHQARVLIGETAQWTQAHHRLQSVRHTLMFGETSESLMTAFDLAELPEVIARDLPRLGIKSCYLSLYEQPVESNQLSPAEWSRLVLAYNENGRMELEPGGRRFLSRQLLPDGVLSHRRHTLMLEPLRFRDEAQLGFILFESLQPEEGSFFETLSRQISTVLRGAMLSRERKRVEDELRKKDEAQQSFSKRLTRVLGAINELSKIDSFDELCRKSVELAIKRLGFDRVGLCFLSEDQQTVLGVYGTDKNGHLHEEKHIRRPVKNAPTVKKLLKSSKSVLFFNKETLYDDKIEQVGVGDHAVASLWNGEKIIGIYAVDNLVQRKPITSEDLEILDLYSTAMGHLFTLKKAEESLKQYSERLAEMVNERTAELREAQEQLMRREKLAILGQLAGGVGHELRNPLGVISNAVYFLQMTLTDANETTREYLGILSSEVHTAEKIVSDLLDFSRVRQVEQEAIAVSELVAQTLKKCTLPENVEVVAEFDPGLPAVVVDARQIGQVMVNLVTNACQAMGAGGRLSISAEVDGEKAAISFTDTGCGIPAENLEKIFEPLFTTRARGIGLGLAVSKNMVVANGGSIEVESEVGKGSTFIIRLPLVVARPEVKEA